MRQLELTFVGHATVLVEMDGVRVLTDPILRRFLGALVRFGPAVRQDWIDDIDAVLISHIHHDHLDFASLQLLGRDTPVFVPSGAAPMLRRRGHSQIREYGLGDVIEVGSVRVEAVRAVHSSSRPPFGPVTDAAGFIVRGSQNVYFAGDTEVFPEMASLGDDIDVALLPVWGWGPTLGDGHMDPDGAAEAASLIRPRLAVPIHWGTFSPVGFRWLRPRYLTDPPLDFARRARELAPGTDVQVMVAGERLLVDDDEARVLRA